MKHLARAALLLIVGLAPEALAQLPPATWPRTAPAPPAAPTTPPAAPAATNAPAPPAGQAEVPPPPQRPVAPAQVTVRSNVPAADVLVDGVLAGRTPLPGAIAIKPGEHLLELRRRGYRDVRRPLNLADGDRPVLTVELHEDPGTPASETGTLAVSVSEDGAVLLVDGHAKTIHRGGSEDAARAFAATPIGGLPMGPHVLRVERAGFLPAEHLVVVPAGDTTTVRVTLRPTPETHEAYVKRTNAYRGWSVALLSAGVAATLAGGALALTRQLGLPEARRNLDQERREQEVPMNGSECDPSLALGQAQIEACDSRLQRAYDAVWVREQVRLIGLIGLGAGLAATGTGIFLLANGDDPRKYDALAVDQPRPQRFWARGWAAPSGGGFLLGLRF
jgi:PEGA domain